MKIILILILLIFQFLVAPAQTNNPIIEYKTNRINQDQKIVTIDLGFNYSNSGNSIYYEDTVRWNNNSLPGIDFGISLYHGKKKFFISEGQFLFNIERQNFGNDYVSSLLTFYYNFLLGYRISDRISLKAGAGLGLVRTLLNGNDRNPISKFEIGDAAFPVVFKTELMTAITPKIFLGLSWTSSFKKPMYKVSSGYVDSYYSQFISINLKFCLSNKQSLIQNNKSFLKFSR